MTKKKLMLILPLALLIVGGGMYKLVLAKEAPKPEPKIHGDVYVLGKDFLVNLADGHFAKLGVALVVEHGTAAPPSGDGHGAAPPKPPEGYGSLPQEAAVRDIVTDTLTDVEVHDVLFTDVSVQ